MGADVEEGAVRELRRAEVAEVAIERAVLALAVVVPSELDPAVQAGVEVVVSEDPRQRAELGELWIGAADRVPECGGGVVWCGHGGEPYG